MDLFLSAQSMGVVAFVAAGCMVAAGAISTGISRRRARLRQEAAPPSSDPEGFARGRPVAVVGRLHVDGSCCPRLEDAAPVAATSFLRDSGGDTSAWCERAQNLWLEVGGSRVELRGPVLVDVGSEEQYPAVPLDRLRGRATERIYAAPVHSLPRRRGTARHGVFRSLRAGDEVVVIGVVERSGEGEGAASYRQSGAGWQLIPDASGVLVACYRRRPRIRGAFGGLQLWAAAMVSTTSLVILGAFAAAVQPTCSDGGSACLTFGGCGTALRLADDGLEVVCVARSDRDCRQSDRCRVDGSCSERDGRCEPARDLDCQGTLACARHDACRVSPHGGECSASR